MRVLKIRHLAIVAFVTALFAAPAAAQLQSNATIKGSYWIRYLGVNGAPYDYATSFAGAVTFDGNGNFSVTGSGVYYSGGTTPLPITATGTYNVTSSGLFSMANPFDSSGGSILFGGAGVNGVITASSTDSYFLDLFVAIPQTTGASNAKLSGNYYVAGMEFAGGSLAATRNVFFPMTADGNGNLGNVNVSGSSQAMSDNTGSQTIPGATYTVGANGSGTMNLPAPSGVTTANQLLAGTKNLYVSPDGSFFISGSPTGYDMQVGVKALTGSASTALNGLFYSAQVENCDSNACGSSAAVYSYGGSLNEVTSINLELVHERINGDGYVTSNGDGDYDSTYDDNFPSQVNADGTFGGASSGFTGALGAGGNYMIQAGGQGDYFLTVFVKVPSYSGTGVFLSPVGVVNASSNAPFTAQLAPGEIITLYGTGLASQTGSPAALPFPTTFNGVQVKINGAAAPIVYTSPTQINAIIPYSLSPNGSLVSVQVTNNNTASNTVQAYLGYTSPGVYTYPVAGGVGNGAIIDGSTIVTDSAPAKVGDTVSIYLTGLGTVSPAVTEGTAAPSNPLSNVQNTVTAYIDDVNGNYTQATVQYAGLAPGLAAGANQLNITIPSGLVFSGAVTHFYLDISTIDAENVQALIPIAKPGSSTSVQQ